VDFGKKVEVGGLVVDAQELINFRTKSVIANDILLNTNVNHTPGVYATIVGRTDLTFDLSGGSFEMGQNEKLTVLGDLTIRAGEATLGDLTTTGDMVVDVDSGTITLLRRGPAPAGDDGNADLGLDFISGGQIVWTYGDLVLAGNSTERPVWAAPNGVLDIPITGNSTLIAEDPNTFIFIILGSEYANFFSDPGTLESPGGVFDLRAKGITDTDIARVLAGAVPLEGGAGIVQPGKPISEQQKQRLGELGVTVRDWPDTNRSIEEVGRETGKIVVEDTPLLVGSTDEAIGEPRLSAAMVQQVLELYDGFFAPPDAEGKPVDRRDVFRDTFAKAWVDYEVAATQSGAVADRAGFRAFVESLPADHDVNARLSEVRDVLQRLSLIGLNKREIQKPRKVIIDQVMPTSPPDVPVVLQQMLLEQTELATGALQAVRPSALPGS
jgi:hypothetical protein